MTETPIPRVGGSGKSRLSRMTLNAEGGKREGGKEATVLELRVDSTHISFKSTAPLKKRKEQRKRGLERRGVEQRERVSFI